MADLNFTTSANNIIAQVVQPEIVADANNPNIVASVSTGNIEVTSTQVVQSGIIGDVSNPNIVASVSTGNIEVTSAIGKEKELSVNTINLGEENIPDPILYYRKNDIASIILSQLYFIIAKKLQDNENLSIQDTIVKLLNTRIEELTDIIDQVRLNFSTVFQDLVDATDDFYGLANIDDDQIASIQKVLIDYLNGITDSLYKSIGKKIELTLVSTDTSKKLLSKISNDSFISLDIITKITEKSLIETKTILEQSTKLLEKVTSDIVIKQDLVNLLINLNKLDTVQTISNFFSIVTFIREFSDQLDATDDFYGLANIDDDQIASFQKVLVDQILLVEQFITQANFLRSFSDSLTSVIELNSKLYDKNNLDQVNTSELTTKITEKILIETKTILEQSTKLLEKVTSDIVIKQDLVNLLINLNKLDTVQTISNFFSIVTFIREFSDQLDATDDFYGLANIDDDQIASFQKVLVDQILLVEQFITQANFLRSFSDSLTSVIELNSKLYDKNNLDQVNTSELTTKITEKILIETKTILEQSTKLLEKVTSDIVIKQDLVNLLINLNKLDTVQTISNFFSIVTFIREFSDQLDATDDFYGLANIDDDQIASFQKVLVDQILLVEQFITQANFLRSFSDTINGITEIINKNIQLRYNDEIIKSDLDTKLFTKILVDKAINLEQFTFATEKYFENLTAIDDNQIVNLQKLLINQVNITLDTFISNINKVLINQLSLSEETIINVNKILSDQTQSILDQAIKLLQKLFNDSLNSVSEVNTKLYNKNNLDEINTSQLASKIIEKSSQDLLTTIDSYKLLAVEKSLLDQTQLQEIVYFLKITTIFFYDQLDATDDFYGLANIDDDQLASLGKVLASSTSGATDFSIRHIMPNKVDSVATSELRSAHIQDYFLEEYVEHTQRYVGTILTI